jgi:hypothetical protein
MKVWCCAWIVLGIFAVGCTTAREGSEPAPHYARYFFAEAHDAGVFEVSSTPPSICYSTQSYPARPITLVLRDGAAWVPVATYEPQRGTYCDDAIASEVARSLLEDPSAFRVMWAPQAGDAIVRTHLAVARP